MKHTYDDVKLTVEAQEFTKDSGKEILQYAVGGLLYTPASNEKVIDKVIDGRYGFVKSLVLDLEDSLGDDLVSFGQKTIVNSVNKLAKAIDEGKFRYEDVPLIFIRIREKGQMKKVSKSLGDGIQLISGFNIPKFDKYSCSDYIEEFVDVKSKYSSKYNLYIMPIIENKTAMYRQLRMDNLLYMNDKLRAIQDNVLNIRVGGADFCSIYGIRRRVNENIHEIGVIRSVLSDIVNVFGKNYVVSGPVWEYFKNKQIPEDNRWLKGLVNEIHYDKLNGFIGKTVIHPSQVCVVQKSLIVDSSDYSDAVNILGMNANVVGVKKSVDGGRMNEVKTHTHWARKVMGMSYVYGVANKEGLWV